MRHNNAPRHKNYARLLSEATRFIVMNTTTPFHLHVEIATAAMIRGDFEGASRLLRESLDVLRAFELHTDQVREMAQERQVTPSFVAPTEGRISLLTPGEVEGDDAFSPNNALGRIKTAFLLPPLSASMENNHVGIVLLYNMGLALHCQGMLKAKHSMLLSAKKFYKSTLSLLTSSLLMDDWWKVLYMSALTNLGNIASHFLDYEEVSICRRRVLQCMDQGQSGIPSEDWLFFSHVVFEACEFVGPSMAAAA